jgi:hypothetical protein
MEREQSFGGGGVTRIAIVKNCGAENCTRRAYALGFCDLHYRRIRRNGTLLKKINTGDGDNDVERFWDRVDKTPGLGPKGECWEWRGSTADNGYGKTSHENKTVSTHRMAWFLATGKFSDHYVLHGCDNKICVRIDHLREGPPLENARDAVERGQQPSGESHGMALINDAIAGRVKTLLKAKVPKIEIARRLEIDRHIVYSISYNRTWRHVQCA